MTLIPLLTLGVFSYLFYRYYDTKKSLKTGLILVTVLILAALFTNNIFIEVPIEKISTIEKDPSVIKLMSQSFPTSNSSVLSSSL